MTRFRPWRAVVVLSLVSLSTGCTRGSDKDQLRALVDAARSAANERDTGGVVAVLAEDFCATARPFAEALREGDASRMPCRGLGKEEVRQVVLSKLLPRGWVRVWTRRLEVKMTGEATARVEVLAVVARGEPVEGLQDLVPDNADVMRFKLRAEKREGKWKFVGGQAERLKLDVLEGLSRE
ncbi:MAG: hypothetical protein AAFU79_26875 [Myxococcota bacterium]